MTRVTSESVRTYHVPTSAILEIDVNKQKVQKPNNSAPIPMIGDLFREKPTSEKKQNLIIDLSSKIIPTDEKIRKVRLPI